jgi:hypothetical protein
VLLDYKGAETNDSHDNHTVNDGHGLGSVASDSEPVSVGFIRHGGVHRKVGGLGTSLTAPDQSKYDLTET